MPSLEVNLPEAIRVCIFKTMQDFEHVYFYGTLQVSLCCEVGGVVGASLKGSMLLLSNK